MRVFFDLLYTKWGEFKLRFADHSYSLDIWHECLQALRQYLRGWSLRMSRQRKEIMQNISNRIEEIDIIA
jgi:hypothetical protein